jgi:hypothetical protein
MALFCCEKCKCIENSAFSNYHTRKMKDLWPIEYFGKALCSECGPLTYSDGTATGYGKWHGNFPKRTAVGMFVDQRGELWSESQIKGGALPEGWEIVGKIEDLDSHKNSLSKDNI